METRQGHQKEDQDGAETQEEQEKEELISTARDLLRLIRQHERVNKRFMRFCDFKLRIESLTNEVDNLELQNVQHHIQRIRIHEGVAYRQFN